MYSILRELWVVFLLSMYSILRKLWNMYSTYWFRVNKTSIQIDRYPTEVLRKFDKNLFFLS